MIMAEKKLADERIYTIPLKREVLKSPRVKRSPRAIRTIHAFLERHMKSDDIRISQKVNEAVWIRGIHKPPAKIKVKAKREGETVYALLPDEVFEIKKKEEKKPDEAQKTALQKKAEELSEKLKKEKEEKSAAEPKKAEAEPKPEKKAEPKKESRSEAKPKKAPAKKPASKKAGAKKPARK